MFDSISNIAEEFDATHLESKKEAYLDFRTRFNASDFDSLDSAVLLYALNKLCFNGLYRENSKGEFNVPFGQKKKFPPVIWEDFLEVSRCLENTKILNSDFEGTVSRAQRSDFVYFDPPYIPLDVTSSFTSYHSEGFGLDDQHRLAQTMINLGKSGVSAMCSNSDTELTREIFADLKIVAIQAPRMVSAKASGRGSISELVIMNY
jgi:DNA adenine methylase